MRPSGLTLPQEMPIASTLLVPETSTREYSSWLKQDNQYVVEWHAPNAKAPAHATMLVEGVGMTGNDVARFIFERDLSVFFTPDGSIVTDSDIAGIFENWDRQMLASATNAPSSPAYAAGATVQLILANPDFVKIVQLGDLKSYLFNDDVFNSQAPVFQTTPHRVRELEERQRLKTRGAELGFYRLTFFGEASSITRIPNEDILTKSTYPRLVVEGEKYKNVVKSNTRLYVMTPEDISSYLPGGDARSPVTKGFGFFGLKKDLSYLSFETIDTYAPDGAVSVRPTVWTFSADEGDELALAPNHNYFLSGTSNFWMYVEADAEHMEHELVKLLSRQDKFTFASVLRIKLDSLVNLMTKDQVFTSASTLVSLTRVFNDISGKRPVKREGGRKRKKN